VKRLRHPIRAIREPFGTAGLIIAVVALVAALGGSAIAAKGALTGKQKKEVAKIAKKEAKKYAKAGAEGKQGPAGPAGAPGPAGAAGKDGGAGPAGEKGATGATGPQGAKGDKGDPGEPGEPGESPVGTSFTGERTVGLVTCNEGGVEYESGGEGNLVCNGEEGSPWTASGTLPVGANETGTWYIEGKGGSKVRTAISFPIKIAGSVDPTNIHVFGETGFSTFCGGAVYKPAAIAAGALCIFTGTTEAAQELKVLSNETEAGEFSQSGAIIQMKLGSEANPGLLGYASGSFAIAGG
jgi:hypothetical protein